ncbi:succinate dehydrogenase cytochrome b subunit [Pseudactinotalea sp.]|uniref:succinate dehydrogenase cytochrome b subunit n=1 Tax=Pseudactinotalea sp. TaxID=1926260 RepID=UPI003B3A7B2E
MTTTAPRRTGQATTIALKLLMAVTGIVFIGYVLLHMYGNLKAFSGQFAFDEYAHHLRELLMPMLPYGGVVWILRVVLLASLIGHAGSAFALWSRANKAREQKYVVKKAVKATIASRTMRWGGVALLAFVVFHVLHLTTHTINPSGTQGDSPYLRLVESFQLWWVAAIYILAMVALGMHLRHGTFSAMQTLGLTGTVKRYRIAQAVAITIALVVAVGFALVPLGVVVGIIE